ncbi:MAG: hypothetical protein QXD03_02575 [Candidatus Anstonellales archaeon]
MVKKKVISLGLIGVMCTTFSGCGGTDYSSKYIEIPLVSALTQKELIDYSKKALEYDSVVRKTDNKVNKYELRDIYSDELKDTVVNVYKDIEALLREMEFKENNLGLKEEQFHYIKAILFDYRLTNASIKQIKQALGHYFIDVEYDISPRSLGKLKPSVSLLGVNGAFRQDPLTKEDSVNIVLLNKIVGDVNLYYKGHGIKKQVKFNQGDLSLIEEGEDVYKPDLHYGNTDIGDMKDVYYIDTIEFNKYGGSSKNQSAYMPKLDLVFDRPAPEGDLSGMGILRCGDLGLRKFGFLREQLTGKITMRYVFKQDVIKPSKLVLFNVYPIYSEINKGINTDKENKVILPEFLMTELSKAVDRFDRAIMNNDLAGLASGTVCGNMYFVVQYGYLNKYTNVNRQISTIRRVLARDIENKCYLVEVETFREEGSKGSDVYAKYKDKYYMAIEQVVDKFVITDLVLMNRKLVEEPDINPDSAVKKRLIALSLAGEVKDKDKEEIEGLLQDLYKASTYRVLKGPMKISTKNGEMTLEKGMYNCFNDDISMLPSEKNEYLNGTLRSMLIKYGVDVKSTYNGVVTEWLGGTFNQAELIAEEVIEYKGLNKGLYLQTYYLVSRMKDKWVIDDIKYIEVREVSGDELHGVLERIQ